MNVISYHKQLRKKEIKKNKAKRIAERDAKVAESASLHEIQAEINKLEKQKSNKNGCLDNKDVRKLERLQKELKIVKASEEERKKQAQEKAKIEWEEEKKRMASKEGVNELNVLKFKKSKASVYYDEILNPFGAPPPGKPMLFYNKSGGTTMNSREASVPQHLRTGVDDDTDEENEQFTHNHRDSKSREFQSRDQHLQVPSRSQIPKIMSSDPRPNPIRHTPPSKLAPAPELEVTITTSESGTSTSVVNKLHGPPDLPPPSASVQRLIKKSKKQNMALHSDIWASTDELVYEGNLEGAHEEGLGKTETIFSKKKKRKVGEDEERFDPLCPADQGYGDYRSSEQIKRSTTNQKRSNVDENHDKKAKACAWYYIDQSQKVQGPFTSEQISSWRQAGFFPDNTMVRDGTHGEFTEITSVDIMTGRIFYERSEYSYDMKQVDKNDDGVDERIALLRAELQTQKEYEHGIPNFENDALSSYHLQKSYPSSVVECKLDDHHHDPAPSHQELQNHYAENENTPYPIDVSYPIDDAYPNEDSYPNTDVAYDLYPNTDEAFGNNYNDDQVPYYHSSASINETDHSRHHEQPELKKKIYTGDSAVVQMIPSNLRYRRTNVSKQPKQITKTPTSISRGDRKSLTDDYEEFMSQVQSLK